MKKIFKMGLWAGLLGLLAGSPALAITLGFQPSIQTLNVGDALTVDILATLENSSEIVSAFDFDLSYDPALLTATGVTFGTALGDPGFFEVLNDFDLNTAGLVDFAALSLLSDADLSTLQSPPSSITLASLSFDAIGSGARLLEFINYGVAGNDIKGANNSVYGSPTLNTASIRVINPAQVPEPSPLLLMGAGLAGLVGFGRRIRR